MRDISVENDRLDAATDEVDWQALFKQERAARLKSNASLQRAAKRYIDERETWIRRAHRERRGRKAAEELLEEKSKELFTVNQRLEAELSGSVKLLTDVLAVARPEIFEKASKVQRWARRIAPELKVRRPWVLELASLLYPLGILSIPHTTADRYCRGEELTVEEHKSIAESSVAAHGLLSNIPHMSAVARAILYCRKGYDGSGYPSDEVRGEDLPQSARILKILIDLADDATGPGRHRDFKEMMKRKDQYDLDILKVAFTHLRRDAEEPMSRDGKVMEVSTANLRSGDIIHRDIMGDDKQLLLAAGAELTALTISRLRSWARSRKEVPVVEIMRKI